MLRRSVASSLSGTLEFQVTKKLFDGFSELFSGFFELGALVFCFSLIFWVSGLFLGLAVLAWLALISWRCGREGIAIAVAAVAVGFYAWQSPDENLSTLQSPPDLHEATKKMEPEKNNISKDETIAHFEKLCQVRNIKMRAEIWDRGSPWG